MEKLRVSSMSPFFNAPDSPTPDAFISYSHKDQEFVKKLVQDCKDDGRYIWLDEVDMPSYFYKLRVNENDKRSIQMWNAELSQNLGWGLYRTEYFIIVLTPDSIASKWVAVELNMALIMDKFIVPILKTPCTVPLNENEIVQFPEFVINERTPDEDSDRKRWFKVAKHILVERSYTNRKKITLNEDSMDLHDGFINFIDDKEYIRSKDLLLRHIQ
jgi:hypothetical protein